MQSANPELVISDNAESVATKRTAALRMLRSITAFSFVVGGLLSAATSGLLLYWNPDTSTRILVTILLTPALGPLVALQITIGWYFPTKIVFSTDGLLKITLGGSKLYRWRHLRRSKIASSKYIPGYIELTLQYVWWNASRVDLLLPIEHVAEVQAIVRRYTNA